MSTRVKWIFVSGFYAVLTLWVGLYFAPTDLASDPPPPGLEEKLDLALLVGSSLVVLLGETITFSLLACAEASHDRWRALMLNVLASLGVVGAVGTWLVGSASIHMPLLPSSSKDLLGLYAAAAVVSYAAGWLLLLDKWKVPRTVGEVSERS